MTTEIHQRSAATQRAKTNARLDLRLDEMRAWLAEGMTRDEMCVKLQCARQTLRRFLRERGLV
jgi:hypothetical protein